MSDKWLQAACWSSRWSSLPDPPLWSKFSKYNKEFVATLCCVFYCFHLGLSQNLSLLDWYVFRTLLTIGTLFLQNILCMVYLNHKVCLYFIIILYFLAITITDPNSIAFYCKYFTINASKGFLFCYNWRIINIMPPPLQITKNNAFYGEVFTPWSFLNSLFLFSYTSFGIKDA